MTAQHVAPMPNGKAAGSNPASVGSIPTGAAIYIDDATGVSVPESWWPMDDFPLFNPRAGREL